MQIKNIETFPISLVKAWIFLGNRLTKSWPNSVPYCDNFLISSKNICYQLHRKQNENQG